MISTLPLSFSLEMRFNLSSEQDAPKSGALLN